MSGLLKAWLMKEKKKENRTASGTSLRSMILPEMISGAQLRWSQKELIPLSATSDKTKQTFLTRMMRWKGKQRFKPEISGWKRARASFKCNTLLLQHYYILYSSDSCASILKVPLHNVWERVYVPETVSEDKISPKLLMIQQEVTGWHMPVEPKPYE